jgi:enoyl-CoA hydratase
VAFDGAALDDEVALDTADGVATVTLRAPFRRNALTIPMARQLYRLCEEIDRDNSIGAVVVVGEGGYFCAGGDRSTLSRAGQDPAEPDRYSGMTAIYRSFARVGALEPPTIAAIRGGAVGAGLNLALATDLRIVGRDAVLRSGFFALGLHPGGGHGSLLFRQGSREAAFALAVFGEPLNGARAVDLGLAWEAVDDAAVVGRALELAAPLGADPELARRIAQSMRLESGPPLIPWAAALDMERAGQMWSMRRKSGDWE